MRTTGRSVARNGADPGGISEAQWFGAIYPRLHRFLPATSVLEIAPGFGRWTRFLVPSCERYIGVDLSHACISACREAFQNASHAEFFENDGTSLSMVPDGSVDLAFSFDSLVHVEMDVIDAYVGRIMSKLADRGVAFIHHSNVKATPSGRDDLHHRAPSVSHELSQEGGHRCWRDDARAGADRVEPGSLASTVSPCSHGWVPSQTGLRPWSRIASS